MYALVQFDHENKITEYIGLFDTIDKAKEYASSKTENLAWQTILSDEGKLAPALFVIKCIPAFGGRFSYMIIPK